MLLLNTYFKKMFVSSADNALKSKQLKIKIVVKLGAEYVTLELPTARTMKSTIYWDVIPCSLVQVYQYLEIAYCCGLQILQWSWRQYVPSKRR
jgi:hypothetical protein